MSGGTENPIVKRAMRPEVKGGLWAATAGGREKGLGPGCFDSLRRQ